MSLEKLEFDVPKPNKHTRQYLPQYLVAIVNIRSPPTEPSTRSNPFLDPLSDSRHIPSSL